MSLAAIWFASFLPSENAALPEAHIPRALIPTSRTFQALKVPFWYTSTAFPAVSQVPCAAIPKVSEWPMTFNASPMIDAGCCIKAVTVLCIMLYELSINDYTIPAMINSRLISIAIPLMVDTPYVPNIRGSLPISLPYSSKNFPFPIL